MYMHRSVIYCTLPQGTIAAFKQGSCWHGYYKCFENSVYVCVLWVGALTLLQSIQLFK